MFIAVDAQEVAGKADQLQRRLQRAGADVRWTSTDQLHVTLKFLGDTSLQQTPGICAAVREAVAGHESFSAELRGAGAFPDARRPRTLWIGVGAGREDLAALHASIDQALLDQGFKPEPRRYSPHLTLGRVRSQRNTADLTALLEKSESFEAGTFAVDEVLLVSSQLQPSGPIYEVLGRAPLA